MKIDWTIAMGGDAARTRESSFSITMATVGHKCVRKKNKKERSQKRVQCPFKSAFKQTQQQLVNSNLQLASNHEIKK